MIFQSRLLIACLLAFGMECPSPAAQRAGEDCLRALEAAATGNVIAEARWNQVRENGEAFIRRVRRETARLLGAVLSADDGPLPGNRAAEWVDAEEAGWDRTLFKLAVQHELDSTYFGSFTPHRWNQLRQGAPSPGLVVFFADADLGKIRLPEKCQSWPRIVWLYPGDAVSPLVAHATTLAQYYHGASVDFGLRLGAGTPDYEVVIVGAAPEHRYQMVERRVAEAFRGTVVKPRKLSFRRLN